MKLINKIVWITGASSGIGEAMAYEFNKHGSILVLSSRRAEELERVKGNLPNKQAECHIFPFDLAKEEEIVKASGEVIKKFGCVDILVNNGGMSQRAFAAETNISADRMLMEVNYFGAVVLTKNVLPKMIERKSGHIVVVGSMMGKFGFPLRSGYCASKHALQGFFEALRSEIKKYNINVTVISPGRINTNISYNAITGEGKPRMEHEASHAKAMTADVCAKKIVGAVVSKRKELLIGKEEVVFYYVKKFFPRLYYFLADKVSPV